MNDLEYSLGLKVENFNQGAKEVVAGAKEISREMKDISKVIQAGGVAAVAIGFLQNMATWAEKSGDKLEDNVQALLRWKKAAEDTDGIKSFAATLVQPFIAAGETIGLTLRAIADAGQMASSQGSPLQYIKNLGSAWANVVDIRAKSIELDKQETATAEERKKSLADQKKLREEMAQIAERERAYGLERMTDQERVNALTNEHLNALNAVAISTGTGIEKLQLANKAREIGLELLKAQDRLQKETDEKIKDAFKEWDEAAKKEADDREKLNKLRLDALPAQEKVNAITAEESKLVDAIAALKLKGLDTTKEEIELLETRKTKTAAIRDLEEAIAAAKKKAKEAVVAEITARENQGLKHAGETVIDEIHGVAVGRARGKDEFSGISDQVLTEILRRNQERIDLITARQGHGLAANPGIQSGFFAEGQAIYQIAQDSANARAVLNQRRQLRAAPYDKALRSYEGDPLNFDRFYQEAQGTRTEQQKTNELLQRVLTNGIRTIPVGQN